MQRHGAWEWLGYWCSQGPGLRPQALQCVLLGWGVTVDPRACFDKPAAAAALAANVVPPDVNAEIAAHAQALFLDADEQSIHLFTPQVSWKERGGGATDGARWLGARREKGGGGAAAVRGGEEEE